MKTLKTSFLLICIGLLLSSFAFGQNYGFTSSQLLFASQTPIRVGARLTATENHVYYIGTNNKICEYFWNGTTWTGGGQLDWSTNAVQTNTQICNNGNELFFVRSTDNRICRLFWNGTWQVSPISTTMIQVRAGTDIKYDNNVIYYVATSTNPSINNKVCYISRPNSNSAFNLNGVLSSTSSFNVTLNTQIIYVGPYVNSPTAHVYFIGPNNRVYDIVKNGSVWTGSTNYLASNFSIPAIRSASQLTNNNNQIFYIGTDNKIYELHWVDNVIGWVGSLVMPTGVQLVKNPSQITFFENHIYYIGATDSKLCDLVHSTNWSGGTIGNYPILNNSNFTVFKGTTGHNIFSIGTDNRVKITLWDDVICPFTGDPNYCSYSNCQGQTWHNGSLNMTANQINATSNIAVPNDPVNPLYIAKSFYFIGTNGYGNVFLRSIINGINKAGWDLTRNDEFNSLATTQSLWDHQLPWSHGRCNNGSPDDLLWSDLQYGTNWNNFSVNNGIGRIETRQQPIQGLTWGWATDPSHNNNYYSNCSYSYTNSILSSGGINVDFACNPSEQYCYCGGTPPSNCLYNKVVNTCGNYVPKYTVNVWGPTMATPKFYQKYGWFEIRCKVPRGKKMWNAFWAVNKGFYPSEIDFFEIEGNGKTMLSNIYYEDCMGSQDSESILYKTYAVGYRYYDDFYTYACEWAPTYIKWYLNNELIATDTDPTRMQHDSMWVIVNNYVVNARAQCDSAIFPNHFDIDYVRIYQNPAWYGLRTEQNHVNIPTKTITNFEIYPNPSNGTFELVFDFEIPNGTVQVFNSHGSNIYETKINNDSKMEIELPDVPSGMYYVKVSDGNQVFSKKIVIEQ